MKTTLNKTELAGALAALGKLVTRTAPVEANRAVEITGFANTLHFRTRNAFEEIEFTMFAEMDEDVPATLVNFEQFRLAVRNGKNKTLALEVEDGVVTIDGVTFDPVKGHLPPRERLANYDVNITELSADTLSALEKLAPVTEKGIHARKMLTGIDISADGLTAANNKELSNIPLPIKMTGNVTIPFPLTLLATKAFGESGYLTTWQKDEDTHFELVLGNWTWRAKALKGNYPNWKCVLPERTAATHYVSLMADKTERIQRYLKSVPDDPMKATTIKLSRIPEVPDHLNLASSNGVLVSVLAEFDESWGNLSFVIRKELLAHLLNQGHCRHRRHGTVHRHAYHHQNTASSNRAEAEGSGRSRKGTARHPGHAQIHRTGNSHHNHQYNHHKSGGNKHDRHQHHHPRRVCSRADSRPEP